MAASILVTEQIDAGRRLIDALDAAGDAVDAAFWVLHDAFEDWRLCLSFVNPPHDQIRMLMNIAAIIRRLDPSQTLDSSPVRLVRSGDTYLDAIQREALSMRQFGPETGPNSRVRRVRGGTLGGVYFEDALIYRARNPDTAGQEAVA